MSGSQKKIVKSVVLARNKHGEPETWKHQESGKIFHSSIITFNDGSFGTYTHDGQVQDYFKVGEEAEFEAKNMGTWWKLIKPRKKWDKHPGGWVPKSPEEVKRDNISFAAGYVKDLVIADKVKIEDFGSILSQMMSSISEEIDKIED